MTPETSASASASTIDHKPHAAFFRQSGWIMITSVVAGAFMFGVHLLAKAKSVDESQYAAFGTLLMVVACLPTMPLQMIFAQQTAFALATGRERQVGGMIQLAWLWTFLLWLVAALLVLIYQKDIIAGWHLPDAKGLWITLLLLLFSLWMPMFNGVLQGRQDFFWLGWSTLFGGAARIFGAAFLVLAFSMGAAGMMAGAVIGVGLTVFIAIWRSRDLWTLPREKFDGKTLMRQVLPLTFGFGACQFMFTSDTMFAKAHFTDDQMAPYVAAGTLSRALLWLVLPLASVMFPKIVHATARSEKSNLFGIVVLGTAVLAICGGLGLWVTGPFVIKLVYKSSYLSAVGLIPWYAGAMVPLAMANVMINDLLARSQFKVVPWMVLLATAYGLTLHWMLNHFPGRIEVVLQTLGFFNLLLFLLCAWFVWGDKLTAKAAK